MDSNKNGFRWPAPESGILWYLLPRYDPRTIFALGIIIFMLYLGAGSAYLLGAIVALPLPISRLFNGETFGYLYTQAAFIGLCSFALFKISRVIVVGLVVLVVNWITEFQIRSKRRRKYRKEVLWRVTKKQNKAIFEGRAFAKSIFLICVALVIAFSIVVFFSTTEETFPITIWGFFLSLTILMGGSMALVSVPATFDFGFRLKREEFIRSPLGIGILTSVGLFLFFNLGAWRMHSMMYGETVFFVVGEERCELAPMLPVFGGDLYYERRALNFVIISGGEIIVYLPSRYSSGPPPCL
jgi:hypothetical protein